MTTLEFQVEDLVNQYEEITICDIVKKISPDSKDLVRSVISHLVIKNGWRIKHECGKLFIHKLPCEKISCVNHRDSRHVELKAKTLPDHGDWVVTCTKSSSSRLFFDRVFTMDEVRCAYTKIEKVNHSDTRVKRYKKIKPIKTMSNF